ncbi:uncharacterized protein LOC129717198 [Wyeomyia smithii]|uniref:uncharacterized protein LOC129717198 n=1 Tax=Wyeomyia smithii TaxID=174621 RepID=UPI002467D15B|nr:uncharacterized protein LOC129717198 [Wyeomyia smithii]
MTGKINDRLNMLKVISGTRNGVNPETLIDVYQALIRSVIEYGCTVTNNACKTNKNRLVVSNNQCLRKITGCTKSTPLNTLIALARQEPLETRQEYLTAKFITKCFTKNNLIANQLKQINQEADEEKLSYMEKVYLKHKKIIEKVMTNVSERQIQVEVQSTMDGMDTAKRNCNPLQLRQLAIQTINGKWENRPKMYTDASKMKGLCGIGVYDEGTGARYCYRLEMESSITSAEISAIETALDVIDLQEKQDYVILTDSRSACEMLSIAMETKNRPAVLNGILEKAEKWSVSFQWIPGHARITGNELADFLAKSGTSDTAERRNNQIFEKDAFLLFKHWRKQTATEWYKTYAEEKGKKYYQIQQELGETPWHYGKGFNNAETRLLNRLVAGHDFSPHWLAIMKIVHQGSGEICDEENTAEHIILNCETLD